MGSKSPLATQPDLTPNADLVRAAATHRHLRPAIHFTPPYGWMNDPCAVGYDPATGLYHLFFQWNPRSCSWGDISWGHRVSTDLLRWTSLANPTTPALRPDQPYDCKGVFSGCFLPRGVAPADAAGLTVFYTAVSQLPIHWSVPYARGCESLAVATSADGGRTWRKLDRNPILPAEPDGLDVTGWRDPHVGAWPSLDALRGGLRSLYGLISGGIRGRGPTAFLYAVDATDLTRWTYVGPLLNLPARFRASPRWSGDFGVNWECTNFMTLTAADGSSSRDFLVTGAEGGAADPPSADNNDAEASPGTRRCLWLSGRLIATDDNNDNNNRIRIHMRHLASGVLDHGGLYAANTFHDPVGNRRILWGWLPEDDDAVPFTARERKGWTGCLGLPRELFLLAIPRVRAALRSPLEALTCVEMEMEEEASDSASDRTFTLRTLGIRPLPTLRQLRRLPSCKLGSHRLGLLKLLHPPCLPPLPAPVHLRTQSQPLFSRGLLARRRPAFAPPPLLLHKNNNNEHNILPRHRRNHPHLYLSTPNPNP